MAFIAGLKTISSIPDTDHVARQVGLTKSPDGRPHGVAFMLREDINETGLSVNWLEKLNADPAEYIQALRTRLVQKGRRVGKNDVLFVLEVGNTRKFVMDTASCL